MSGIGYPPTYKTVLVKGADSSQASGTILLSHTPPAGFIARVIYVANDETFVGSTTQQVVVLQIRRGANVLKIDTFATSLDKQIDIVLQQGDSLEVAVETPGVGGSPANDILFSLVEHGPAR